MGTLSSLKSAVGGSLMGRSSSNCSKSFFPKEKWIRNTSTTLHELKKNPAGQDRYSTRTVRYRIDCIYMWSIQLVHLLLNFMPSSMRMTECMAKLVYTWTSGSLHSWGKYSYVYMRGSVPVVVYRDRTCNYDIRYWYGFELAWMNWKWILHNILLYTAGTKLKVEQGIKNRNWIIWFYYV